MRLVGFSIGGRESACRMKKLKLGSGWGMFENESVLVLVNYMGMGRSEVRDFCDPERAAESMLLDHGMVRLGCKSCVCWSTIGMFGNWLPFVLSAWSQTNEG